MPNKPEFNPALPPGDATALSKALFSISRFLLKPPGLARVQYTAGGPNATVQVTNRTGQSNAGTWSVLLFVLTPLGASVAFAPTATTGIILTTLPGGRAYIGVTDAEGLLAFTLAAPLTSGNRLLALVLGEPDFAEAP